MTQNIITYIRASEQQVSTAKPIVEIYGESLSVIIVTIVLIKSFYAPEETVSIVSVDILRRVLKN